MRSAEGISIGRSAALADNSARFITHQVSLIIFFILLLWAGLAQAELSAFLTAGRISMGDTVQLQVEAEGQISASPDTQPLEQDFDVLGVASGSRVNIINGRMDSRSTWSITLSPKRSGTLTIPPLELHGEQTQPLTLQVSEVPVMEDGTAGNDPVFIETEVDISDPYVQGMLLYTLRLFYEVKLMGGRLSEPKLDNALVRRLGKDREYHTERNGRRYRVLERQYAIFPQTSGKLELPAPILEARIPDKRPKSNSLLRDLLKRDPLMDGSRLSDLYTTTHPIRVRGKPRVLQVRPRPAQMQAHHWLPAQNLVLIESWKPAQGELRVGNPLTRSIIIKARGATGAQLPELAPGYVDGFKVYPDRSQTDTLDLEQGVEGEKKQNVAYVPLQPG
ncbi:MAG: BatD family protein, partial [Chromatiales bacterium]